MVKTNRNIYILIFLFSISMSINGFTQEVSKEEKKAAKKAKKQEKIDKGKPMLLPLVGPAYTPEMKFTVAGGFMFSFKTNPKDTLIQRSSSPFTLGVSSTGAYFVGTKLTSFWRQDSWRINADVNFKNMADNYYGIGYEDVSNNYESDSTTAYTRTWFQFYPKFLYQFKTRHFVGPNLDINYTKGNDASKGVAENSYYQEFNDKPFNVGLGIVYQYDSRDVPVNAWKGWYLETILTAYGTFLGGNNNYLLLGADYRKYWRIKRNGRTIAMQIRGRFTAGDVPYGELSQLGTPFDLRGYRWGQYRHESMFYGIGEYRHQFKKHDGTLSKLGAVGWIGAGTLGENVTEFKNWLPNAGLGFRIEVQPRMSVRLDYGFGKGTSGFYFNFNEAF